RGQSHAQLTAKNGEPRTSFLERNIVVRDSGISCRCAFHLWRALIEIVFCPTLLEAASTAGTAARSTEQHQFIGDHFGHIFLLTARFVVPRTRLQSSLDINLVALLQVFARDLRQSLPQDDVVPLGCLLPLATRLVLVRIRGRDRDLGHRSALRRVLYFRIFPEIAYENNFVNALRHEYLLASEAQI